MELPQKGDIYTCQGCGMALVITENCNSSDVDGVILNCCGREMDRQTGAAPTDETDPG